MPTKVNAMKIPFVTILVLSLMILTSSCKKTETAPPPQAQTVTPPAPEAPQSPAAEEVKEKPVYVYAGDRYRDPFAEVGQTGVYQSDAIFNPNQARVKAIIYGTKIKSAVIQIAGSGSYFVTQSQIIDIMGKTVKGFKAQIFPEKVLIKGEGDEMYELKIRETEGEGKTL